MEGEPDYDYDADLNRDGIVDMRDLAMCSRHLLWEEEYPLH
jgi:hypothetical protein